MRLASLQNGSRDGALVVVDRKLQGCRTVPEVALTLQAALDRWSEVEPALLAVSADLDGGRREGVIRFDPRQCAAPLPRAFQWADCSAYVNHVELIMKSRGLEMPPSFWTDPFIYQGGSDDLLGACEAARFPNEADGIDLEAEIGVITDDVPMGTPASRAGAHVKLLVLLNDWSLRNLMRAETPKGFGFFQSKPATAFSPVAITPDELGSHWRDHRVHLPLRSYVNDTLLGQPNAGVDMVFGFDELIAHAARTRNLRAGSIIGSGTVSNLDRTLGSSCLAERRTLEMLADGQSRTPFLKFGDRVRIDMRDPEGRSLFGALDQIVAAAGAA